MKEIIILGSTGSIGTQTLEIVAKYPDKFCVVGMSCNKNWQLFLQQVLQFCPRYIAVPSAEIFAMFHDKIPKKTVCFVGDNALEQLVSVPEGSIVVTAIVGLCGLVPTMKAIECGKNIALANKETLVACGSLVMQKARDFGVEIYPVDSEHSAIWQCLEFNRAKNVSKLILTASGGPFRTMPKAQFESITKKQALCHPTWNMGAKVTIDSATMMNKGLEIIEAMHLFSTPIDLIDVVVHPQSVVHSMVEFIDGSIIAQMGVPSMVLPIQLALTFPDRLQSDVPRLDFSKYSKLDFEVPDTEKFLCLKIARECAKAGGLAAAVMNAANEVCVEMFLKDIIKFYQIPYYISKALDKIPSVAHFSLQDVLDVDISARNFVLNILRC